MPAASLCVNGPVCIPLPHQKPVGADVFGATLSPIGLEDVVITHCHEEAVNPAS